MTPIECGKGKYCPGFDATGRLGATAALPCPPGTYSSSVDLALEGECTDTSPGFYAPTGSIEQTACSAGTFTAAVRQASCQPCEGGTFTSNTSSTACQICLSGHFCPVGASTALPCKAGTFSNATNLTSAAECTMCPAGSACSTGAAAPNACNPGSCAPEMASSQCTLCLPGTFSNAVGGTSCQMCRLGFLCPAGASMELPAACKPGTFVNASDGDGDPDCLPCSRGHYCGGGAAPMRKCSPGSYAASVNMDECTACSGGKYQGARGQIDCELCTGGSYCPSAASAELPCPAGTYSTTRGLSHAGNCTDCPEGAFCATGSIEPTRCVPGYFADRTRLSECMPCLAGEYQSLRGATACGRCTRGSYCLEGASTPQPCPGGTSSNVTGVKSVALCKPVRVNEWAPLGSFVAESCEGLSGFFCPGAAGDEVNDPPGSRPIIMPVGTSTVTEEVEVVQQQMTLAISPEEYNETAVRYELALLYGIHPSLITLETSAATQRRKRVLEANVGGLQLTITIEAPPESSGEIGTPSSTSLDSIIAAMEAVDNAALSSSIGSALGMNNITIVKQPPLKTTETKTVEFTCPRGKWCTAGLVVDCPVGSYNPLEGQNFATACTLCPPDSSTTTNSSTGEDDCLCGHGFYDAIEGPGVDCKPCPWGTRCDGGATLHKLNLTVGYWRLREDSLDVRRCPDAASNCTLTGQAACSSTTTGCRGGMLFANASCAEGLTGPFCMLCNSTDAKVYRKASTRSFARCEDCESNNLVQYTFGMYAVAAASTLVALLVILFLKGCLPRSARTSLSRLWTACKPTNKFKVIISFYQIVTKVEPVYEVSLPATVRAVLALLSVAVSFGLGSTTDVLTCMGLDGFLRKLLFWMILPLGLSLFIFLGCLARLICKCHLTATNLLESSLPLVLRLLFIFYPIVCPLTACDDSRYISGGGPASDTVCVIGCVRR